MSLGWGDNAGTTFGGHHPLKILEGKNVQNLVQCKKTFEFDREYLWNAEITTSVKQCYQL